MNPDTSQRLTAPCVVKVRFGGGDHVLEVKTALYIERVAGSTGHGSGELPPQDGEGLGPAGCSAVDAECPSRAEHGSSGDLRLDAGGRTQGGLADTPVLVLQEEADPTQRSAVGTDCHDATERGVEQIDHMGPEVEKSTTLEPPGCGERSAQQPTRDELTSTADDVEAGRRLEEGAHWRGVAEAENHLRDDARLAHGIGQAQGTVEVLGNGLLEQEGLAATGGGGGQLGLHRWWHRERDGLTGVEEILVAAERPDPEAARQLAGRVGPAGPHAHEMCLGPRCQHRPVNELCPRSRTHQAHVDLGHGG